MGLIKLGQSVLGVQQRLLVNGLRASALTEDASHGTLEQREAIFLEPPAPRPAQHSSEGISETVLQPSSASGRVQVLDADLPVCRLHVLVQIGATRRAGPPNGLGDGLMARHGPALLQRVLRVTELLGDCLALALLRAFFILSLKSLP